MSWNWRLPNWPHFFYDSSALISLEQQFLQGSGGVIAILKHLDDQKKKQFIVEVLSTEGLKSAEIEGEILERDCLQSSIQRHFGLRSDGKRILPKERGVSDLIWSVYNSYDDPLTHETLYEWHAMLMHHSHIEGKGKYRTHEDPMQIVSRRLDNQTVYFEAPPAHQLPEEMTNFIEWYNESRHHMPPLGRAAIAHVYFESIHPFEDGNGRIGRALVEKALSQSLGQPTLIAISEGIARRKRDYYDALGSCNQSLNADRWVHYFAQVIVDSQIESISMIDFLMTKSQLINELKDQINSRQEKALLRMFQEGPKGFSGGLSASNYMAITKTSHATATRDLGDLVEKGALRKTGKLRHTRYWLNIKDY